jgi:hypothetical protein
MVNQILPAAGIPDRVIFTGNWYNTPKHVAFSVIATHLSHRLASNARQSNTSRWRWIGRWTQFRDQPQDVAEQMPGDGDLGHLKRDVTTWLTTFAPILIGLSFRVVIDQSLIGSGVANVRRKLPRL